MTISDTDRLSFQEAYCCTWYPARRNGEGVLCYDMPRRELQAPTYREALDRAIEKTKYSLTGGVGWKLAMRVMQSDLYAQLDDAEKAECDALAHCNPYFARRRGKDTNPTDPESYAQVLPIRTNMQYRFEDIEGPEILAKDKDALSRNGTGEYVFNDTQARFVKFCEDFEAFKRSKQ